jgi:hypothetical protein
MHLLSDLHDLPQHIHAEEREEKAGVKDKGAQGAPRDLSHNGYG